MTSTEERPKTEKKYGIATIANDKVFDWLLAFLESYSKSNSDLPLYIIPYDDNIAKTRQAARAYGVTVADVDSVELDALARRLYPFNPKHRRRLRKFLSLALPLDEVAYLDVDIVLFRNLRELFGRLETGATEFIVACRCFDYVYNDKASAYPFLKDAMLFNDGFFLTSKKYLSLQTFYDVISEDEKLFHTVRQRGGLYAQPLTNFVVHRRGIAMGTMHGLVPGISAETYHLAKVVDFAADGPRDEAGNRILFCHWAGVIGMPRGKVFDPMWHSFHQDGKNRLLSAA